MLPKKNGTVIPSHVYGITQKCHASANIRCISYSLSLESQLGIKYVGRWWCVYLNLCLLPKFGQRNYQIPIGQITNRS